MDAAVKFSDRRLPNLLSPVRLQLSSSQLMCLFVVRRIRFVPPLPSSQTV
jgi:hypothetical protein